METNLLPLVFAHQPKPQFLDFPFKNEAEPTAARYLEQNFFAAAAKPSRHFETTPAAERTSKF